MSSLAAKSMMPILFLALAFLSSVANAEFILPEKPSARVNDYSGTLRSEVLHKLENRFAGFERISGNQAVVAVFKNLDGGSIDDIAVKLFEKWKLGSKEKNNGVLLIIALEDRAVRIEVGYGLEDRLTDALASRIIREDLVPFLKEGHLGSAILVFSSRLDEVLAPGSHHVGKPVKKKNMLPTWILSFFVLAFFINLLRSAKRNRRGKHISSRGVGYWSGGWGSGGGLGGWSGGGGFGGSSGGFGGGGGGLSGGGGASGRW